MLKEYVEYMYGYYFVLFLCYFSKINTEKAEVYTGTATIGPNQTFIKQLGGPTRGKYKTITWRFQIQTNYIEAPNYQPILYIRHEGQESGYGTDQGCFTRDFGFGFGMDPRLVAVSPYKRIPEKDKECIEEGGVIRCEGSLGMAVSYYRRWYTTFGFRCGYHSPITVRYNLSYEPVADGMVPCSGWPSALDQLQHPIAIGVLYWIDECSKMYPQFSTWNPVGLTQTDIKLFHYIALAVEKLNCYQHSTTMSCRLFLPECRNGTVILPCDHMCTDLYRGCSLSFLTSKHINVNMSCSSFTAWPVDPPRDCYDARVTCDALQQIPSYSYIASSNGTHLGSTITLGRNESTAGMVVPVTCGFLFRRVGNSTYTCGYSGEWERSGYVVCELMFEYIISTGALLPFIFVTISYTLYSHKRTKLKDMHFLIYDYKNRCFAQRSMLEPLRRLGFNIHDADIILPGTNLREMIEKAIQHSGAILVVIDQSFVDSEWCCFEFEKAIEHKRTTNPSLVIVAILLQPLESLSGLTESLSHYLKDNVYLNSEQQNLVENIATCIPKTKLNPSEHSTPQVFTSISHA